VKVRELMRQLQGVSPDLDIVVRGQVEQCGPTDSGDQAFIGGITTAALQRDDGDTPYFAIDCSEDQTPAKLLPTLRLVLAEQLFAGVVPPMRIVAAVARAYDVEPPVLLRGPRTKVLTEARFVCWWLLRAHTRLSLKGIGRMFKRDHTTILTGVRKCDAQREAHPQYRAQVEALRAAILV
jgi:hypothetical protein